MSLNPVLQARMLVLRAREGWVLGRVLYVIELRKKRNFPCGKNPIGINYRDWLT